MNQPLIQHDNNVQGVGPNPIAATAPEKGTDDLPFASIVVTVKNEEEMIEDCLKSLLKLDYQDYEILVVDTGSDDKTREIVRGIQRNNPKIELFETLGNASVGRNVGVKEATGDVVAFTDGDCIAEPDWLRILVSALVKDGISTAGVGGPNIPSFEVENHWTTAAKIVLNTLLGSGGSVQFMNSKTPYVRAVSTANSVFWTSSIKEIGCFDSRLDLCEDADLCSRLAKTGSRLKFENGAVVYHRRDYRNPWKFGRHLFKYGYWRGRAMMMKPSVDASRTSLAITGGIAAMALLLALSAFGNWTATAVMITSVSFYLLIIVLAAAILSKGVLTTFVTIIPSFLVLHASYAAGMINGILSTIPKPWKR